MKTIFTNFQPVLPVGAAVTLLKKGATGGWSGSGATTVKMMSIDSMTHGVIAAARNEKSAALFGRYTQYGSVEGAFTLWVE